MRSTYRAGTNTPPSPQKKKLKLHQVFQADPRGDGVITYARLLACCYQHVHGLPAVKPGFAFGLAAEDLLFLFVLLVIAGGLGM